MLKFYLFMGFILFSPIWIPIFILELTINIPLVLYGVIRLYIKKYNRKYKVN